MTRFVGGIGRGLEEVFAFVTVSSVECEVGIICSVSS